MSNYVAHCESSVYGYERRVYVDSRLRDHPSAQCGIIKKGETIFFVSYETIVCEIDNNWLHCYGTFSVTTAIQIGWFLKQMKSDYNFRIDLCTYQTAKRAYEKDIEINLYNGDERQAHQGMIKTVGIRV